jgi:hypothetical protein
LEETLKGKDVGIKQCEGLDEQLSSCQVDVHLSGVPSEKIEIVEQQQIRESDEGQHRDGNNGNIDRSCDYASGQFS